MVLQIPGSQETETSEETGVSFWKWDKKCQAQGTTGHRYVLTTLFHSPPWQTVRLNFLAPLELGEAMSLISFQAKIMEHLTRHNPFFPFLSSLMRGHV